MPTQPLAATPGHYDLPPALGATLTDTGTEFACYAGHATSVALCLFDTDGREQQIPLHEHAHGVWAGHVDGVRAGQRYGFRADGPYSPGEGDRHNRAKLLLDPYARSIVGDVTWRPEVFGHVVDERLSGDGGVRDDRDSAAYVPRSVVVSDGFDWGEDRAPCTPWTDTVVYEAHVRGLTMQHPDLPVRLRGTYAGVAHPATIAHLTRLGVTAIELLPVHAFTSEPRLIQNGLTNYWGYNTMGFFAPHAAYASTDEPLEVINEFKGMVKLLHAAGIEVILDVVYNHTCEQSAAAGATLSWRGLDNAAYYRLDERGCDVDVTGCGNTVDMRDPVSVRLVLDSLRYWAQEMHVDGFRFDLAVALARGLDDSFHPDHPFLVAMRADPVLSSRKLIAEPWDIGSHGWRTGQFPPPMAEWNDRFRDTVRTFWLPDVAADLAGHPGHGLSDLGTRIAGSQDLFGGSNRPRMSPMSSVSMVTAHDGFTAADLTAYNQKHNEGNLEHNADGGNDNHSWNFGVEGQDGVDDETRAHRRRSIRNLLASLFTSAGVPMLLGGDELGRTQQGNNNAYCQDNPISWLDWDLQAWQRDLIDTTAFLTSFRAAHPVLRQRAFFPGSPIDGDTLAALRWHAADGALMTAQEWNDGRSRTVQVVFDGADVGDGRLLFVLHGGAHDSRVRMPEQAGVTAWDLVWDSTCERPDEVASKQVSVGDDLEVSAGSFVILLGV
ncbi:glycogen debranching protein GlgX [Leekyejoonella antrihumi]|uniref:Glycogen debranching protein GlgX n=1 Tax=Leekyejoonella antrihumi TaxID=1660198 RepID=A0A563E1X7_9MICO|nr:glycogen debranching protein GlgX [Leekyejoonella antrihumi]TWP36548.1 glycogen debranching protein GlgX [Leekyejoonella antrihumi]